MVKSMLKPSPSRNAYRTLWAPRLKSKYSPIADFYGKYITQKIVGPHQIAKNIHVFRKRTPIRTPTNSKFITSTTNTWPKNSKQSIYA